MVTAVLTVVGVGVVTAAATVVMTGEATTVVLSVVAGRDWVNIEPGVSDVASCDVVGWVWESGRGSEVGITAGAGVSGADSVDV